MRQRECKRVRQRNQPGQRARLAYMVETLGNSEHVGQKLAWKAMLADAML